MSTVLACIAAFISGAIFELGCVFWVHNSEAGNPKKTAMWSMLNATCEVVGIGESIRNPAVAPFFIAGYGFGSWLGVRMAKRQKKVEEQDGV